MAKESAFAFMTEFVLDYINGKSDRLDFDLDFNHYLIEHYPKMERENAELADCFAFHLAEQGFDQGISLSDDEHKKLIIRQWNEFNSVISDDIW